MAARGDSAAGTGRRIARAACAALLVANLAVAAAWFWRDRLVDAGWLAAAPPTRVDLPPLLLPPIDRPPPALAAATATVAIPASVRSTPLSPSSAPSSAPPATPPTGADAGDCTAVGPFDARDAAEFAQSALRAAGWQARLVVKEQSAEPDYRVYVAPLGSNALAWRTRGELIGQGIADAYVIEEGEHKDGVATGFFRQRGNADRQRRRVAALGYDAAVQVLRRSQRIYQVMVPGLRTEQIGDLPGGPCDPAQE